MNVVYYADSSVLVKRHIAETGSAWVSSLTSPRGISTIASSAFSLVEVSSAFCRQKREKTITDADFEVYVKDFEIAANNEYDLYPIDATVIAEAQQLLEKYTLTSRRCCPTGVGRCCPQLLAARRYAGANIFSFGQQSAQRRSRRGLHDRRPAPASLMDMLRAHRASVVNYSYGHSPE